MKKIIKLIIDFLFKFLPHKKTIKSEVVITDKKVIEKIESGELTHISTGFALKQEDKKLLTVDQLKDITINARREDIEYYIDALNGVLPEFKINTELRVAHFIAQIAHESGEFKYSNENLNYGKSALRGVFGKYFHSDEMAEEYERKPEKIANIVYANRMGNGGTESGEGYKYRGRGLIQLTGKNNYSKCGEALGVDLVEEPEFINSDPVICVCAACWYWESRGLNQLADNDDVRAITKRINGGYNGIKHRTELTNKAKEILA